MASRQNAGIATGIARNILELAVYNTAAFAHIFDLPSDSPVSGSHKSRPFSISTCLMNQLLAKPPAMQAVVAVMAFSMTSLAPVAAAEAFKLIYLIVKAMATDEATAMA